MPELVDVSSTESPAKRVARFVAQFDPAIAKLVRSARAALRKRFPTAIELVYDNYNALAIGFGSTERTSDCIVSLAVFATGVNLYFIYGRRSAQASAGWWQSGRLHPTRETGRSRTTGGWRAPPRGRQGREDATAEGRSRLHGHQVRLRQTAPPAPLRTDLIALACRTTETA